MISFAKVQKIPLFIVKNGRFFVYVRSFRVLVEELPVAIVVEGVGEFVYVETACRGIEDIFIDTTFLVELVWVARLFYTAVLEGIDHVGIDDLADAVADDDDGTVALDGINGGFDLLCGDGIEAGGGFVEEDDGRILEEHAGDGDALLLTA